MRRKHFLSIGGLLEGSLALVFAHVWNGKKVVVKADIKSGSGQLGRQQGLGDVLEGITALDAERADGPGENDRHTGGLDFLEGQLRRVGHGVRPVYHDDGVVFFCFAFERIDDQGAGVGQLESAQNIAFQLGTSVGEATVQLIVSFFDGSAGDQHGNMTRSVQRQVHEVAIDALSLQKTLR